MRLIKKIKIVQYLFLVIMDILISLLLIESLGWDFFGGLGIILFSVTISVIVSSLLKYFNSRLTEYFIINGFLFPAIFFISILLAGWYAMNSKFIIKNFSKEPFKYQLTINKPEYIYQISKIKDKDGNSQQGVTWGKAIFKRDTVYLLDLNRHKRIIFYKDSLIGFPNEKDTLSLK